MTSLKRKEREQEFLLCKIWELRPLRDRILFFAYIDNKIVLLSHFQKKTQKTPKREIKKAEKLMNDYIERGEDDE